MQKWFNNYNRISSFQIIASIFTFFIWKLVPIILAVYGKMYIDKNYNNPGWSWISLVVIFWLSYSLFGFIIHSLQHQFDKLDDLAEALKPKPFTDKYGKEYKRPTFEQFDLNPEDYYKFNRSFRPDSYLVILGVWLLTFLFAFMVTTQRNWKVLVVVLLIGVLFSIATHQIIKWITLGKDKKSPHYEKIKKYNEALDIYRNVGEENGDKYRL